MSMYVYIKYLSICIYILHINSKMISFRGKCNERNKVLSSDSLPLLYVSF